MAYPKTVDEMTAQGYEHLNDSTCRSEKCGEEISWWQTTNGKRIPMDKHTATPHWDTCCDPNRFKK